MTRWRVVELTGRGCERSAAPGEVHPQAPPTRRLRRSRARPSRVLPARGGTPQSKGCRSHLRRHVGFDAGPLARRPEQ